jgi:hypothetical protein
VPSHTSEPAKHEAELAAAARYEANKDSDEWEEPLRPARPRRLATVISVRLSPDELEIVKAAAGAGGVSRFVREATVEAARRAVATAVPARDAQKVPILIDAHSEREPESSVFVDSINMLATTVSGTELRVEQLIGY